MFKIRVFKMKVGINSLAFFIFIFVSAVTAQHYTVYKKTNICSSLCNCSGKVIDYSGQNKNKIPSGIPADVEILDLSYNNISDLKNMCKLHYWKRLRCVSFENNRISILKSRSFHKACFPNITVIFLQNNKIQTIEENAFNGLSNVITLHLQNNDIETIDDVAFQNSSITHLNLSDNKPLGNIPRLIGLNNLKTLNLNGNRITNATFPETFESMTKLEKIVLSSNKIQEISSSSFVHLKKSDLRELKIAKNNITTIAIGAFKPLTKIKYIHMPRNKMLYTIPAGVFAKLTTLKAINLSFCGLCDVSADAFQGLQSLQNLNLSNNRLASVPRNLPPSLEYLYLNGNDLTYLSNDSFKDLTRLKHLSLNDNRIFAINNSFRDLINLEKLNISNNKLKIISRNISQSFINLISLEMNNCDIKRVIRKFSYFLIPLKNLKILSLKGNSFTSEDMEMKQIVEHFSKLKALQYLDLSENKLRRIPTNISNVLSTIRDLKLRNNRIAVLDPYLFKDKKKLRKVDLSNNLISFLNSSSVEYLRSNSNFILNLSNNPFTCDCSIKWFQQWLKKTKVNVTNRKNYKCNSPSWLFGKRIINLTDSDIQCKTSPVDNKEHIVAACFITGILVLVAVLITCLIAFRYCTCTKVRLAKLTGSYNHIV